MTKHADDESTGCFALEDILKQARTHDRRRLTATFTCLSGRLMGKVYKLDRTSMVIGRSDAVDIHIEDDGLSRRHAEVSQQDGVYSIHDLGSTNGTACNGDMVQGQVALRDGDRIRLGPNVVLRFEYQDELEEEMQSKLYDLATRDPLTGAYNRRFFLDRLASEWAWAFRHRRPCSIIAIDIDHFKRVNDTYGHSGGDIVLKETVVLVHQTIRKEDLFARMGGEEFIVLARATSLLEARVLAERLRLAVQNHRFHADGRDLRVTISMGISVSDEPGASTPDLLIRKADERLYRAKESGRNRSVHEP